MPQSTTMRVKCEKCDNEFDAKFYHAEPPTESASFVRAEPTHCGKCGAPVGFVEPNVAAAPKPEEQRIPQSEDQPTNTGELKPAEPEIKL